MLMDENGNYSVALNIVDMKIANLNMKILEKSTPELEKELDKYLKIKREIYKGNTLIMKQIIDGKEK